MPRSSDACEASGSDGGITGAGAPERTRAHSAPVLPLTQCSGAPAPGIRERILRMTRAAEIDSLKKAIAVFGLLEEAASASWLAACPPVRAEGGDAFVHMSNEARKPEHWTLPKQLPDVDVLRDMARAMEQILSHFDQGKLDGKRWSLRHTHALWDIFFPGTPPPQKLKDRQMYELDTDMPPGEIEAVIVVAMCMLFNDDLLNTKGNARPQAARNLEAIAGAVGMPVGVGAVDEARESGRQLLIVTNLRAGRCVQRADGVAARSKGRWLPSLVARHREESPLTARGWLTAECPVFTSTGCGCMGISGHEAAVAREMQHLICRKVAHWTCGKRRQVGQGCTARHSNRACRHLPASTCPCPCMPMSMPMPMSVSMLMPMPMPMPMPM